MKSRLRLAPGGWKRGLRTASLKSLDPGVGCREWACQRWGGGKKAGPSISKPRCVGCVMLAVCVFSVVISESLEKSTCVFQS